jgi:hypothetical protein
MGASLMPRAISLLDRISVREGVRARLFDGEWVILDLIGGNYFGLNEAGGLIWQQLAAGRSLEQVTQILVSKYDAAEATIAADVLRLARELVDRGLIELDPVEQP